jgi:Fe-S-cluster containining protein
VPQGQVDPASELCLACGLCCDGGLFDLVNLEDDDRARLAENGLGAPEHLPHPCPHYISSACSIYAIRPFRCRDYQCRVLEHMLEGELSRDEAHALVDQALAMRVLVQEVLPQGLTVTKLAQDVRAEAPENRTRPRLLGLARFVAYRLFVERHFLGAKARWMSKTKA